MRIACAIIMLSVEVLAAEVVPEKYYVAPHGSDEQPGTFQQPFRSIARAQSQVRKSTNHRKQPITVLLREGTTYLDDTIVFSPEDSGTPDAPVTYSSYQGEKVIISGGTKLVLEWEPYRDGILQTKTPARLDMDKINMRDLKVGKPGKAPMAKHESEFIIGLYAPNTRPGTYDLYVSIGQRDGTPTIAMPLKDDDGQRRYRLGSIILEDHLTASN